MSQQIAFRQHQMDRQSTHRMVVAAIFLNGLQEPDEFAEILIDLGIHCGAVHDQNQGIGVEHGLGQRPGFRIALQGALGQDLVGNPPVAVVQHQRDALLAIGIGDEALEVDRIRNDLIECFARPIFVDAPPQFRQPVSQVEQSAVQPAILGLCRLGQRTEQGGFTGVRHPEENHAKRSCHPDARR